jgi:hypothetical protein
MGLIIAEDHEQARDVLVHMVEIATPEHCPALSSGIPVEWNQVIPRSDFSQAVNVSNAQQSLEEALVVAEE